MYESHFGFHRAPFPICQGQQGFFISESVRAVLPPLLRTLRSDLGIAVLTGPPGCGKTTLLRHLRHLLKLEGRVVVCSAAALETPNSLHEAMANAAAQQAGSDTATEGRQSTGSPSRWQVLERLQRSHPLWGPVILLVDDSHLLPVAVLNELRAYTDETSAASSLVRCLLAGPLSLEEELAKPSHADIGGRIRCHVFLQSLTPQESMEYLRQQLHLAGAELEKIFTRTALEELIVAAGGMTRCLNLLADESLLVAADQSLSAVERDCVLLALRRLQHLPYEWNIAARHDKQRDAQEADQSSAQSLDPASPAAQARYEMLSPGVIEFGSDDPQADTRVETRSAEQTAVDNRPVEFIEADSGNAVVGDIDLSDAEFSDAEFSDDMADRNEVYGHEMPAYADIHEATVSGGDACESDPDRESESVETVFDRYTWIELGREVPAADQLSFTGQHDHWQVLDLTADYHSTAWHSHTPISIAVTSDQEIISSLLKNSPTDAGREFYLRRYSQIISAAEDPEAVMGVTEDLMAILAVAVNNDVAPHEADAAATNSETEDGEAAGVDAAESDDAVTIPFRSSAPGSPVMPRRSDSANFGKVSVQVEEELRPVARMLADLQQVQESVTELSQSTEAAADRTEPSADSARGRFDLLFSRLNDLRANRD